MPDFPAALLSFGKFTGVFDASGSMSWSWFGDPLDNTLKSMAGAAQRQHVGVFFRALLDRTTTADQDFDAVKKLVWEPVEFGPVKVGFVWNKEADGLHIGFGAGATFPLAGQSLTLSVLAGMLDFEASGIETEFGAVSLSGNFPVPPFITAASLHLETLPDFKIGIDVTAEIDGAPLTRTLAFNAAAPNPPVLAWDALRIAAFVLEAWTDKQQGDVFRRIDDHLFPMLGSPPTINSLPPFDDDRMGQPPDFTGPNSWKASVLTTAGDGAGALTMLWHAKALITGNEDPNFLGGSFFFPIAGGPNPGSPPTLANLTGPYTRDPNVPGAWIGVIDEVPNQFSLVLDLTAAGQLAPRIELARVTNGTLSRPQVPDLNGFLNAAPNIPVGNEQIHAEHVAGNWQVTLLNETLSSTGVPGFDGNYKLQLVLPDTANGPVAFRFDSPFLQITLPPEENLSVAKNLLGSVGGIVIDALTPDSAHPLAAVMPAVKTVMQSALAGSAPDFTALLGQLVGVAGSLVEFIVGSDAPFAFTFPNGHLTPEVRIGPIKVGEENDPSFYIGKITASAEVDLANGALAGATLGIVDFRIGTQAGAAGSLVGSLLPDMKEGEGFSLSVNVLTGVVEGGGKIPIQKSLGPLDIAALLVELREKSFSVGIDMSFELGPIRASVFELGIRFFFKDGDGHNAGDVEPFLNGLGVAMDTSAIKLAGMFLRSEDAQGHIDYLGAATVAVVGYFELSAIGGYTQIEGESSLFIFASLVAPLGGPPYFFITGIAGGFGYNRLLPPTPEVIADHPFMAVMRGEVKLELLSGQFVFSKGNHWIAAGIQFRSFGFIDGKVVIAVQFGHDFAFQLLGLASFAIEPLVYFEIGISAHADAESFQLKAGISPNSYLLHPDIFSLRGDFGLYVFYGGPHAGDFILSIGGYHPAYAVPSHYPALNRVGVKCTLYEFIRLSVEVYFACTPQALMAGASISLSAEFEGIGCGLDVYVDVFIQWDPFFLQGTLGIVLWFEFLGRHEISVELEIHTPPLGGTATIDLEIVSFSVDFGEALEEPPPPPIDQFFTNQLAVPAEALDPGARVATFNTADVAGLVKLDVLYGRTEKVPKSESTEQEGIAKPIGVDAEFAFAVRTRLPFDEPDGVDLEAPPGTTLIGKVNVPLCEKECLTSKLKVTGPSIAQTTRKRRLDMFPEATFGDVLQPVQPDQAQGAIGDVDPSEPSIPLTDTIEFHYIAKLHPASPPALTASDTEPSLPDEDYPLPLGWPHAKPQVFRIPKSAIKFSDALSFQLGARKAPVTRRASALAARVARVAAPLVVNMRTADLQRLGNPTVSDASTVAQPPAGAAIIAVPASPARRTELFGVNLRIVPPHLPVSLKRRRLEKLSPAKNLVTRTLTPRGGARGPFNTALDVEAGKAAWIDLVGGTPSNGTLRFEGQQIVRTIYLAATGELLSDVNVNGSQTLAAPARTRRVVFIGEGRISGAAILAGEPSGESTAGETPATPPTAGAAVPPAATAAPVLGPIGIEHDSVLLALGNGVFAGHGCILKANTSLALAPHPLDSVPGHRILRAASNVRVHFPPVRKSASLLLAVEPLIPHPGNAVREIRWRSLDAKLHGLHTVLTPNRAALLMSIEATPRAWSLEIDLGKNWRLAAVVVVNRDVRDLARTLRTRADWDMIDDRRRPSPRGTVTHITAQIAQ